MLRKKKNLNIAMLSFHTCPLATLGGKDTGGMNVYVKELTRYLGRLDVHVDVFTRSQDEHVPHVIHDLGYGNRVVHIPAGPEIPLPKPELAQYIPDFADIISQFSNEKKIHYDVIHSHYWMSGIAGKKLKKEWHVPMISMFHTLALLKNKIAASSEYEGDYRVNGEKEVIAASNRIVVSTEAEVKELVGLYNIDKIQTKIIPPGVNLGHFYPIDKEEARAYIHQKKECMILFVGRIEPLKGIDTLMRALGELRKRSDIDDSSICLTIIGGDTTATEEKVGEEMARLFKIREELGVESYVNFIGKKGQDELPYYYSAANMVVVPSKYESFGIVALEAMACGTPVIASDVGGLACLVKNEETGFTVPDGNPEALADKIALLMKNPELRNKIGTQAARYSKQYGWASIAKKMVRLYQREISKF
jgi:D-inositol-3-phosphate glycosyltransferase